MTKKELLLYFPHKIKAEINSMSKSRIAELSIQDIMLFNIGEAKIKPMLKSFDNDSIIEEIEKKLNKRGFELDLSEHEIEQIMDNFMEDYSWQNVQQQPWFFVDILLSLHVDIFGWIEKGLATEE